MSFGYAMLSNLSIRALARPLMEEMAGYARPRWPWRPATG